MDTLEAIRTKRSVRQFTDEPVPREIILKILDAGRHAQSSKNVQPWTFILVQDRERLKALSECGAYVDHIAHAAFAIVLVDHHNWSFDIGQAAAYLQLEIPVAPPKRRVRQSTLARGPLKPLHGTRYTVMIKVTLSRTLASFIKISPWRARR